MKILAIETSCDETALAILSFRGGVNNLSISVLGNALYSQTSIHAHLGGVVPMLAKREHGRNLVPLLEQALREAKFWKLQAKEKSLPADLVKKLEKILEREPELSGAFFSLLPRLSRPTLDAIAVTRGPGLEPALWVGVNFARALSLLWNKPLIPVNHMEGHIYSSLLLEQKPKHYRLAKISYPAVSLLISGGHTELVLIQKPGNYSLLGATRDDAVGEAFDKVARMLGLPYPGGPHVSRLAEEARKLKLPREFELPRPMLNSKNLDFSFAGLKTAVLYALKKIVNPSEKIKQSIALEFENAASEVLTAKTHAALEKYKARALIVGGGVAANTHIRRSFQKMILGMPKVKLFLPERELTTDNAVMIGVAGYLKQRTPKNRQALKADGNLKL